MPYFQSITKISPLSSSRSTLLATALWVLNDVMLSSPSVSQTFIQQKLLLNPTLLNRETIPSYLLEFRKGNELCIAESQFKESRQEQVTHRSWYNCGFYDNTILCKGGSSASFWQSDQDGEAGGS